MNFEDFFKRVKEFKDLNQENAELIRNRFQGFNATMVVMTFFVRAITRTPEGYLRSSIKISEFESNLKSFYEWLNRTEEEAAALNYICKTDISKSLNMLFIRGVIIQVGNRYQLDFEKASEIFNLLEA